VSRGFLLRDPRGARLHPSRTGLAAVIAPAEKLVALASAVVRYGMSVSGLRQGRAELEQGVGCAMCDRVVIARIAQGRESWIRGGQ